MRKSTKRSVFILILVVLFGYGCGGGGGGSSAEIPASEDIRGTYKLTTFYIDAFYGQGCSNYLGTAYDYDFDSWSGSMEIGDSSVSQALYLRLMDFEINLELTGTYYVTYAGAAEGVLYLNDGFEDHDEDFTSDGFELYTTGECSSDGFDSMIEYYTWKKTADYVESQVSRQAPLSSDSSPRATLADMVSIKAAAAR